MSKWTNILSHDPIESLLRFNDKHLFGKIQRYLLDENPSRIKEVPSEVKQILKKQQPDGSWIYKNKKSKEKYPSINHELFETFKSIRILVGKYNLNATNENLCKAIEYIFSCQSDEGDIRGILGNQYMPYYCGLILELITRAGYNKDIRVHKAIKWLIDCRQDDSGWIIPMQTAENINTFDNTIYSSDPIKHNKSKPSSHSVTGMVLRAFSTHSDYNRNAIAINAANFLKGRFFKSDTYNNRKHPDYWVKFEYPYWWTTILSSLDSLHNLGFSINDKNIASGIEWLLLNQKDDGLWGNIPTKGNIDRYKLERAWISYDICRILKLYIEENDNNFA